jgi:Protein of unknown function (DUF2723)
MNNRYPPFVLFIVFIIIYYAGSFSHVPFGDSIGFAYNIESKTVETEVTALSHFLYMNFLLLVKAMLPMLTAPEVGRWVSVFAASLCISLIYIWLMDLVKKQNIALLLSVCFGLSFSFWRNAGNFEVYTFNLVFVLLFYIFCFRTYFNPNPKYYLLSSFILGISLTSHIQNLFLCPALVFLAFRSKSWQATAYLTLPFLLIVPIIYGINIAQNIPFKLAFSSNDVHWVEETFQKNIKQYAKDLAVAVFYVVYNFWFLVPVAIIGFIRLLKQNRNYAWFLLSLSTLTWGFSVFYNVSDNYTYFLPVYVLLLACMAPILESWCLNPKYLKLLWISVLLFPLYYLISGQVAGQTAAGKSFDEKKSYKGGLNYYMYPWQHNNVGILKFTIEKKEASDDISWMTKDAQAYIKTLSNKYTLEEIKQH